MIPALIPSCERLAAERRRDLGLADQLQVDRQGADLQDRRQVLRLGDAVEAAGDLGAGAAVDPVRVFGEVDDRPRLDFVVEDDREVAGERVRPLRALAGPIACAWPRWAIRRVTSWKASRPLSVKSKVTFGWPEFVRIPASGSVMSVPESAGLSLSAYQPGSAASIDLAVGVGRLFGDDDGARPGLRARSPLWDRFLPVGADVEVLLGELGAGDQFVRLAFLSKR